MRICRLKSVLFTALLLVACNGCITGSLITIGTVLGALGSAASTGSDVYKLGKLDAVLMTSAPICHAAVLNSANDLGLKVEIDQQIDKKNDVWEMTVRDQLKSPVGIHIESRTDKMCRCRVDVGFFGSEPTARLFMERIRAHLNLPAVPVAFDPNHPAQNLGETSTDKSL
jgi:hypothetical protein